MGTLVLTLAVIGIGLYGAVAAVERHARGQRVQHARAERHARPRTSPNSGPRSRTMSNHCCRASPAITDRNAKWTLVHTEGMLYVTRGTESLSTPIVRHTLTG